MSKSEKELPNNEKRLICEIKSIAQKIARNRSRGYSTDKLEAAFMQKRTQAESKGIKIKDYAMFQA